MKVKGWCLEIDGELCPAWFQKTKRILRFDAHALLPPYGTAKIVRVNLTITKQRRKKE